MELNLPEGLQLVLLYSTLPGGAGGLASFLFALKRGHYRHDKYASKITIELAGAMLTASFISLLVTSDNYRPIVGFMIGLSWSNLIQMVRVKITRIVEAALGDKFQKEQ